MFCLFTAYSTMQVTMYHCATGKLTLKSFLMSKCFIYGLYTAHGYVAAVRIIAVLSGALREDVRIRLAVNKSETIRSFRS